MFSNALSRPASDPTAQGFLAPSCKAAALVFAAVFLGVPDAFAQQPAAKEVPGVEAMREEVRQAPVTTPLPGERCVVCDTELESDDVVLIVRGRRVPLMNSPGMKNELLRNVDEYIAPLQPRGALFHERLEPMGTKNGWLFFGIIAVALLLSAGFAAAAAIRRGLDPRRWFFQGLFGNIAAPFIARRSGAALPELPAGFTKLPRTAMPLPCRCGWANHPAARQCGRCGAELTPIYVSEAENVS